jgi:hypothetical protein
MAKPRKIKISIPTPCKEKWDNMTPDGNGRYCGHCTTLVTDFSAFTDRELVEYLSGKKGKMCGRFENSQLNRIIAIQEPSNTPMFRRLMLGTALAAGVAGTAHSQDIMPPATKIGNPATPISPINSPENKQVKTTDSTLFKGIVKEYKSGKPIPQAQVVMEFDSMNVIMVYTDSLGHFSVPVPNVYLTKKITIIIAAYRFTERTIPVVLKSPEKEIIIKMQKSLEDDSKTVGEMML